ncbi:MAG TPA: SRPBCC family protein [Chloroflexota bacterium]|jgi:uncharacterized protein YndB with AHSA1/START domain
MARNANHGARGDVYRLGYRWLIDGPIETVYHFVSHGRTYPEWFPVFLDAQGDDGEVRVGASIRYHVKALLPYHLHWDVRVTRLEPPHLVETNTTVSLSGRFRLSGWVRFTLRAVAGRVEVLNEQEMVSEQALPGPLRALATRAFAFNHDQAMAGGGRGLQRAVTAAVAARQTPADS